MAQDFRNAFQDDLPTSHHNTNGLLWTGGDYDAVIGLRFANVSTSQVTIDVYIRNNSTDYYIIKTAPIPAGSSLELIDSGSKIVMKNGDVMYGVASAASSVDAIVSVVDTISA